MMIVMRRLVEVDGKIRTDSNYPSGFMDVIRLAKTEEQFRVLYDVKGRFVLHPIEAKEGAYKLLRVQNVARASKGSMGRNYAQSGQAGSVPYLTTHDGRTIRYPDPLIKRHDVIKYDIKTHKISGHLKFEVGNLCMVTKGNNVGRVGQIVLREKHPGSFDIVHIQDRKGNKFATRLSNVFIIGEGANPWISLPKNKGVKPTILEERAERMAAKHDKKKKAAHKAARAATRS
jgi:small subunit ribosomal protein S4e